MTRRSVLIEEAPWLGSTPTAGPLFDLAPRAPSGSVARSAAAPRLSEEQVGTLSPTVFGGRPYRPASPAVCMAGGWTVALVSIATGEVALYPFRCKSWRCTRCAPQVNARAAVRIEGALGRRVLDELLFLTLTFDQRRMTLRMLRKCPGIALEEAQERARAWAWRVCGRTWKRLRDALAYRYGHAFKVSNPRPKGRRRKAWLSRRRKARIDYVQTWEQHRSGWPHVHAVFWAPEVARDVRRRGFFAGVDTKGEPRDLWRWTRQVLVPLAVRAGFGRIADVQFPRKDGAALAGYLVKLAGELTGSHSKDQTPVEAPRGFRRLRATPKWLSPVAKAASEWTGAVLGAPVAMVERALRAGAEGLDRAAAWARSALECRRCPTFTALLRGTLDPPRIGATFEAE